MKEFDFRDYNVRVWSGDVFIHAPQELEYAGDRSGEGIQTNSEDVELQVQIVETCRKIGNEFVKLNDLIDRSKKNQEIK